MSHLLRSLRYFETRNVSATYLPLKLKVIESDSLNREEISWVKNLKMKFFHDICQVVKCSKEDIEMAIAVQSGQLALRHKLMYSYFGMMKERFQRLIEECLELNIQGINPMMYDLCVAITGARSEHLATFEQKLHFLTQSPHLHHFPQIHRLSTQSYLTAYKSQITTELMQKQLMTEKNIASFVMNLEVYLLVILDTLLKFPINRLYQRWQHAIQRLLFKNLRWLCGTNTNVEELYHSYSNNVSRFLGLIHKLVREGNDDPDEL